MSNHATDCEEQDCRTFVSWRRRVSARRVRRRVACWIVAGAIGTAQWAAATPAASQTAPSTEEIRQAQARWAEGKRAFEAGNYEAARVAFRQALTAYPHPALLQNLGEAELRLGRNVEAARHLSQYLRQATTVPAAQRRVVTQSLESASARLGSIAVHANTDDAEVKIDGEFVGKSPLQGVVWYVEPGRHSVAAHKDGYIDVAESVEAPAGTTKQITLTLRLLSEAGRTTAGQDGAAAVPPTTGGGTTPGAGATGASASNPHRASGSGEDGATAKSRSSDAAGGSWEPSLGGAGPRKVVLRDTESSSSSGSAGGGAARTAVLIGEGVLTAAGIAVGTIYLIGANNARDDMAVYQGWVDANLGSGDSCGTVSAGSEAQSKCQGLDQSARDRDLNHYISIAGFAGAGLAATAFVTTLVLWKPGGTSASTLLPMPRVAVTPGHGFTSLTWRF